MRFRTGKCLLPLRITGNIAWGVPAPDLEGSEGLTVWVWPESLWAPISFTQTALSLAPEGRYSSRDWHDWWCSEDARVYQFIGQDNIYFYCVRSRPCGRRSAGASPRTSPWPTTTSCS